MASIEGINLTPDRLAYLRAAEPYIDWPSLVKASKHAQDLYDAGAPLFTKEILRHCADQLDAFCDGQDVKFVTTGLDGAKVEAPRSLRQPTAFGAGGDTEYVPLRPKLRYHPIQSLTTWRDPQGFQAHNAFLTTDVSFPMEEIYVSSRTSVTNPPVYSPKDLQQILQDARTWETSPYFERIRKILSSSAVPSDLNKIVGFGFGSLTDDSRPNEAPIHQHTLMLLLRDLVLPKNDISCIAQDPAYTDADKQALASAGVTVADDPRAFLEVDERSVVLSFSPNAPVKQIVTDISRPGIIIWMFGNVQHPSTDPDSPRVDRMIQEDYERVCVPDNQHFGPLEILIRRPVS